MKRLILIGFFAVLAIGCEQQNTETAKQAEQTARPADAIAGRTIMTTFYPLEFLTQRIAGEGFAVVNPCPPDADPAQWQPSAEALAQYQQADLIVINGASFEKWVAQATLPEDRVVDTTAKLREPLLKLDDTVTHNHGHGEHSHAGPDGHTWVDPLTAGEQALAIQAALTAKWPDDEETFVTNILALQKEIKALGNRLAEVSQQLKTIPLVSNHPTYNYLARRYQWDLTTFDFDPDELPSGEEVERLKHHLSHHPTKWILWESAPTDEVEAAFREQFGLSSVVFSPAESLNEEQRAAGEDYLSIMNTNIDQLERLVEAAGSVTR